MVGGAAAGRSAGCRGPCWLPPGAVSILHVIWSSCRVPESLPITARLWVSTSGRAEFHRPSWVRDFVHRRCWRVDRWPVRSNGLNSGNVHSFSLFTGIGSQCLRFNWPTASSRCLGSGTWHSWLSISADFLCELDQNYVRTLQQRIALPRVDAKPSRPGFRSACESSESR